MLARGENPRSLGLRAAGCGLRAAGCRKQTAGSGRREKGGGRRAAATFAICVPLADSGTSSSRRERPSMRYV